jgi:hypothetical protein
MSRKILIMGLPGAGKTTLAGALAPLLNAAMFNADEVRANINKDLGFSHADRIEHARRMGWICDRVVETGGTAIADFHLPYARNPRGLWSAFTIWVDRIKEAALPIPMRCFVPPERVRRARDGAGECAALGREGAGLAASTFDARRPTALLDGALPAVPRWDIAG